MKKLFAMMSVICLLMLTLAPSALTATLLQDEQPPKLLTENVSLVMTDVHDRYTVENEQVKARLTGAYATALDTAYHTDLLVGLVEDPHNLVLFELFDVDFAADSETRELKLQMTELNAPVVTLFTEDGANWVVLPTVNEGNVLTVEMPASGILALMCDMLAYQGAEADKKVEIATTETGEATINFMPSVSGKSAPEVVTFKTETGTTVWGYICNVEGEVVNAVVDRTCVLTSSVAESDYVLDITTHERLESAYEDILNAENVGDLLAEGGEGATIADALDAFMKDLGSDLAHNELVVKDLFEVSVYGDYLHEIEDPDYYLEMTFDIMLSLQKPLVVLQSVDGETWYINENVTRKADGTLTVKLYDLGVVAFLVEGEFSVDAQDAVQAP